MPGGSADDEFRRPLDEPAGLIDPRPALTAIAAADPGFDRQRFLDRLQELFFRLKQAWQDREAGAAQPFMTPGMFAAWNSQIETMTSERVRNVLENLAVQDLEFVTASHSEQIDRVTVRINAVAGHYAVAEATGEVVFGSTQPQPLTEYWTLERPGSLRTPGRAGNPDLQCPTCGAPLQFDRHGHCRYCQATVSLASLDWTVSRVSDVYEFPDPP